MKKWILVLALCSGLMLIAGCGGGDVTYVDGTYVGRSGMYTNPDGSDDGNGYGEVTITIENGVISDCTYLTYEPNEALKDEDYGLADGEVANRDFYNKAQKAVAACAQYSLLIVENNGVDDVDAISGATVNYELLEEAMDAALTQAVAP